MGPNSSQLNSAATWKGNLAGRKTAAFHDQQAILADAVHAIGILDGAINFTSLIAPDPAGPRIREALSPGEVREHRD